jgi:hypothetical protein
MPKSSWRIGPVVVEKIAKDGKKLRKMSTGVQIWTRLERSKVAKWAALERQVEALIRCVVAQPWAVRALPRNVFCVFQWQSI